MEKFKLYSVRFLLNLVVLGILGGAGYLIYYTTDLSVQVRIPGEFIYSDWLRGVKGQSHCSDNEKRSR